MSGVKTRAGSSTYLIACMNMNVLKMDHNLMPCIIMENVNVEPFRQTLCTDHVQLHSALCICTMTEGWGSLRCSMYRTSAL